MIFKDKTEKNVYLNAMGKLKFLIKKYGFEAIYENLYTDIKKFQG